jgi:hypothetical protein
MKEERKERKEVIQYASLIEKFKKENIEFYSIEIEPDYVCFLKKADRTTIKQVLSLVQKDNISGMYLLFQNTWIGGDKEIMEDSELFLSAISTIGEIFKKYDVTFEKIDNNYKFVIDNKECIIRKPKIAELSKLFSTLEKDPLGANELLLNTCWLSGDEDIKKNDDYFLSLSPMLENILNVRNATLKKN